MTTKTSQSGLIKDTTKLIIETATESAHKRLTSPKRWAASGWKKSVVSALIREIEEMLK